MLMKKLFIISTVVLLLFVKGYGQNYIPFPDSAVTWVFSSYDPNSNPPPMWNLATSGAFCSNGKDTVINNILQSKVFICNGQFAGTYKGSYHDSLGMVFFTPKDSIKSFLLYDFTKNVGDTIHNLYLEDGFNLFRAWSARTYLAREYFRLKSQKYES